MDRDWESWLGSASGSASATEEQERDRTEQRIRNAISGASDIPSSVRVYAKGSYANGTNVRRDADVDIAVEWTNTFYVDTLGEAIGKSAVELGYTPAQIDISPQDFRSRVERAVLNAFGNLVDSTPDKHIAVQAGPGILDADVVPCFEMHRFDAIGAEHIGHRIFPKSGGYVDNFPQQHKVNGNIKNQQTNLRHKEMVRCSKRLIGELFDNRIITRDYPSYLVESLVYNVPNGYVGNWTRYQDMQNILSYLWNELRNPAVYNSWTEPSELIWLFQSHPNRSPTNAQNVIGLAWDRIGVPA